MLAERMLAEHKVDTVNEFRWREFVNCDDVDKAARFKLASIGSAITCFVLLGVSVAGLDTAFLTQAISYSILTASCIGPLSVIVGWLAYKASRVQAFTLYVWLNAAPTITLFIASVVAFNPDSETIRDSATEAWKHMSKSEKEHFGSSVDDLIDATLHNLQSLAIASGVAVVFMAYSTVLGFSIRRNLSFSSAIASNEHEHKQRYRERLEQRRRLANDPSVKSKMGLMAMLQERRSRRARKKYQSQEDGDTTGPIPGGDIEMMEMNAGESEKRRSGFAFPTELQDIDSAVHRKKKKNRKHHSLQTKHTNSSPKERVEDCTVKSDAPNALPTSFNATHSSVEAQEDVQVVLEIGDPVRQHELGAKHVSVVPRFPSPAPVAEVSARAPVIDEAGELDIGLVDENDIPRLRWPRPPSPLPGDGLRPVLTAPPLHDSSSTPRSPLPTSVPPSSRPAPPSSALPLGAAPSSRRRRLVFADQPQQ